MKIYYLSSAVLPSRRANTIQVVRMCEAFATLGHHVTLVYPLREEGEATARDPERVLGFYGVATPFSLRPIAASSAMAMHWFGVRSAWAAVAAKADIVYGRFLPAVAWACRAGVPGVFEVHQPLSGWSADFYLSLVGHGRRLRGLVAVTAALAQHVSKDEFRHAAGDRVRALPDGTVVAPERTPIRVGQMRQRLGMASDRFTAVYAGHLYKGRGVELIVDLAENNSDISFLVVGGDPDAVARYQAISEGRGLGNMRWTGFVQPFEVMDYLQAGDVLLMPYQRFVGTGGGGETSKWMSPLKMFEYMASGTPIVASELPVLREVLHEGVSLFCSPDDTEQWSNVLRAVRDAPERFQAMGKRAQTEAGRYSWLARASRCLELYELRDASVGG